jgi:hypothetical protein
MRVPQAHIVPRAENRVVDSGSAAREAPVCGSVIDINLKSKKNRIPAYTVL